MGMKINNLSLIFLIFNLLIIAPVFSADSKPVVYGEVKTIATKKNSDGTDSSLQKLLSIQGVDTQYKACTDANTPADELSKCVWDGDGSGKIPPLPDDLRKKVQQAYAAETSTGDNTRSLASGSASGDLTIKSKQIGVDYMSDPAVVELSKVFEKKLQDALLGDEAARKDTKTVASVDHEKFIELYKTELGKTVVNSFTSYCMETDSNPKNRGETSTLDCKDENNQKVKCPLYFLASKDKKKAVIDNNIASLKTASFKDATKDTPNADSAKWTQCIQSVTYVCYNDFGNAYNGNPDIDVKESKTRACVIMDYVKAARKNLILADKQTDFYKELAKNQTINMEGNYRKVEITDKNSMDATTTITSKDIETSYEKKNDELKKEVNDCVGDDGKIIAPDKCKKFISTDTDEKKKELAEYGLRQFAQGAKIEDSFKGDNGKNEVQKYLSDEGYKSDQIQAMLNSDDKIKEIKDQITKRYQNERDALIATMAKKIDTTTTKSKDGINVADDSDKMKKIKDDINSRAVELKQLVHFDNVVSSYLEIDTNGKKSRNVASLSTELNNGSDKIQGTDAEQIKEIKKNAGEAGLLKSSNSNNEDNGTNLSVENLNSIIKYTNEK